MDSSRFIQLNENILLEYIYTDGSNPDEFNTSSYPIEIMNNSETGDSYFFNTDSVISTMGNARDISSVPINQNKTRYVSLNKSMSVPYNDNDSNLTNSINLLESFSPDLNIVYDSIKVHFISGFSFNDFDGYIFQIYTNTRDERVVYFSNINYMKSDTPVFNPNPFILAEKLYSTYIEWKVPALYYVNNNFNKSDTNNFGYRLTGGKGFKKTPTINIKILGIKNTEVQNGYSFYNIRGVNSISLLNRDIYDYVYASIQEADDGDYFKLNGENNNGTFEDFISFLNSQGNNYSVFHEISVSEQVNQNFTETSRLIFTQKSNFNDPITFRPVIKNSAFATSFTISYILRIYNNFNNTQIIKKASLSSFEVKKYGKRLQKINLSEVPVSPKIYNKVIPRGNPINVSGDQINLRQPESEAKGEKIITRNKYITTFRDRNKIKVSISPARIQNIKRNED